MLLPIAQLSAAPQGPASRTLPSMAAYGWLLWLLCIVSGCTTPSATSRLPARPFDFQQDTFAFTNELRWIYKVDPITGEQSWSKRPETPAYSLRCFVMTQRARQFWWHARFDASQPPGTEAEERRRVRSVLARSDCRASEPEERLVIPGYESLREFSRARGLLLQEECGEAWRSYVQRGHWRMVFPFARAGQAATAKQLEARLRSGTPCVVHVVRFPSLKINHALLLFDVSQRGDTLVYKVYDPNTPGHPIELVYHPATRRFELPTTEYFVGGFVNVYEVYRNWMY
jgi:hypothetical protein